jgi:hypothetical protein
MPAQRVVDAEVYASHSQFYVADPTAEARTDLVWDGAALERRLGAVDGLVAVGTVGYCFLPVRIELWDAEPPHDLGDWDHLVEASLDVGSGRIVLAGAEGEADLDPIEVERGTYRLRSSATGLDGADEMDGGDRYRVQLWPAPAAEPTVLKWWPPWDPAGVAPRPTASGRLLVGAEAEDHRRGMSWLASRGSAHLFRDDDGLLWEHSNLPDASATPQLEELTDTEARSRYGDPESWAPPMPKVPGGGTLLRNILQTLRYQRGWRPPPGKS